MINNARIDKNKKKSNLLLSQNNRVYVDSHININKKGQQGKSGHSFFPIQKENNYRNIQLLS